MRNSVCLVPENQKEKFIQQMNEVKNKVSNERNALDVPGMLRMDVSPADDICPFCRKHLNN